MSEFKGTKGKWEVDNDGVYSSDPNLLDNIVCLQPDPEFDSSKNWKCNAHLISKAPEMLEMLKGILSDIHSGNYPNGDWKVDEIEQLIKEATI